MSVRLFAALELPGEAVAALEVFRADAADPEVWRPVPASSLHVTLAFLGPTDEALVDRVRAALRASAAGPAPPLVLGDALLLPPRRARVLCAELEDSSGALADLQRRVGDALAATGAYTPEKRPFRAHVTLARLRPRARAPRTVAGAPEPVAFDGTAATLFVSRPSPHGARYEALERVPLDAGRTDD